MKTFYLTTPIYYANSLPHLGHLYTTTVADAIIKHKKQRGFDTYFLTGTDEHGINIQRVAEENGKKPKEYVDYISGELKKIFAQFGIANYDIFMRTTEPFHYEGVQHLWREIAKNKTPKGNSTIYKDFYEAWFCPNCAEFKTETEYEIRDGEEIPRCLVHEKPLDLVKEESYFFRLSDYSETLLEIINENPNRIRPEARRNEVIAFINQGLQDLSISREKKNVYWGIPVPDDENHTMYVWMDALSNYVTAIGYGVEDWLKELNEYDENLYKHIHKDSKFFDKYWKHVTHIVGKDILRFHTVYWWSFLLAAGLDLPNGVFAHGLWLDGEGRKMGKALGNIIHLDILHKHFSNDEVRYFVLREMVFGQDGRFSYENLIERSTADLAKGLGNLSSRTLTMIRNFCNSKIPSGEISEPHFIHAKRAGVQPDAQEIASILELARNEFIKNFDEFAFHRALEAVWNVIARVDKFLSDAKPWDLIKDENQRETINAVLYRAVESLRWLSVLLYPVLPDATQKIYNQIGLNDDISTINPESLKWGELQAGTKIGEIEGVFPRLDKKRIMSEIETEISEKNETKQVVIPQADGATETEAEEDNFIGIEDFLKVELIVGQIKVAERIPKADKLLRFEIDLGEEKSRQILAGIAQYYEPENLIGRKVVVVANLKPRKMRGLESQGMICAASLEDGTGPKPALASFIEDVEIGARLK